MPRISAATLGEHRAQTVKRIFDAVSVLSKVKGIDAISMTDVAAEAGVARTVLYNYFPDKAALLLSFAEHVTDYYISIFQRDLPTDASATDRLEAYIALQLGGLIAHPHPGAAEITAALGPDAYHELADHVAPLQAILVSILDSGIESGVFRSLDVTATARSVLAVIGAERLPLIRRETTVEDTASRITALILGGVRA